MRNIFKQFGREGKNPGGCIHPPPPSVFGWRNTLGICGLSLQLKKRMVKSLLWSVTLYASETWTLRKEDIKRLEAFEMWIWRWIERINWMEHWKNVDVLLLVNENRSLIDTIRQRQKNWISHILRGESLLRTVLEGRIPGKKTRGRPRMMLLDWMMDGERKMNYSELKKKSSNRQNWRQWNPKPAWGQSTWWWIRIYKHNFLCVTLIIYRHSNNRQKLKY